MGDIPKVSVVVPVYNAQKYLQQCLDSIRGQSLKEIEIICLDDGSTDNSLEILRANAECDDRIRVIHNENQGPAATRNQGMQMAQGKYLSFLDADDFFESDMLEIVVQTADKNEADITIFDVYDYDDQTSEIQQNGGFLVKKYLPDTEVFSALDIPEYIYNITMGCAWNKLYRKEFIRESGLEFQNIRRVEDAFFAMTANVEAKRICCVDRRLIYYRRNIEGSQQGRNTATPELMFAAVEACRKHLKKKGIFEIFEKSFNNWALENLLWDALNMKSAGALETAYEKLRTEYLQTLGLENLEKEYFYKEYFYKLYEEVRNYSVVEYLFRRNQENVRNGQLEFVYSLPAWKMEKGSRVVLYGAGNVGCAYFYRIMKTGLYDVVMWTDSNYRDLSPIISDPERIRDAEFDYIIVAVKNETAASHIKKYLCEEIGVDSAKIVWK